MPFDAATPQPDAAPVLRRTLDAAFLNQVANDPAVRDGLGGQGVLDLSALVNDPSNVALVGERGGFVLQKLEPGLYEAHTLFLPGAETARAMRACLSFVFTQTDAMEVCTKVPVCNPGARGLARAGGFERRFTRENAWTQPGSGKCGVDHYALSVAKWLQMDAACHAAGETFHAELEVEKARAGSPLPVHEDDAAHDHAAGAAVLMARGGQPIKAVNVYNAWARFVGYQPIQLLSLAPVVIDVVDAIVGLAPSGEMQVLSCR